MGFTHSRVLCATSRRRFSRCRPSGPSRSYRPCGASARPRTAYQRPLAAGVRGPAAGQQGPWGAATAAAGRLQGQACLRLQLWAWWAVQAAGRFSTLATSGRRHQAPSHPSCTTYSLGDIVQLLAPVECGYPLHQKHESQYAKTYYPITLHRFSGTSLDALLGQPVDGTAQRSGLSTAAVGLLPLFHWFLVLTEKLVARWQLSWNR